LTKPAIGMHEDRRASTARAAFVEIRGHKDAVARGMSIAGLPAVEWKGRTLRTLRCHGETGRGPHDQHVPESLLWALISLKRWKCPFHV